MDLIKPIRLRVSDHDVDIGFQQDGLFAVVHGYRNPIVCKVDQTKRQEEVVTDIEHLIVLLDEDYEIWATVAYLRVRMKSVGCSTVPDKKKAVKLANACRREGWKAIIKPVPHGGWYVSICTDGSH